MIKFHKISIKKYFSIVGQLIIWFRWVFFGKEKRSIYDICISYIFVLSNELIKELKRFTYSENVTGVHSVLLCLEAVKIYVNTTMHDKTKLVFFSLYFSKKNLYIIEFLSWLSLSLFRIYNFIIIVTKNTPVQF